MVGIAIACGIFVLAIILVIVLFDIHRLRINTKKVHDELLEIRAKLDACNHICRAENEIAREHQPSLTAVTDAMAGQAHTD